MKNATQRIQEKEEEFRQEQNYYNGLFKDMLKEAHAS